jgi:hypothetical protein
MLLGLVFRAPAHPALLPGGSRGQDAAVFSEGAHGQRSLAAAYAFSDEVWVYQRPGDGEPYAFAASYAVGLRSGTQNDLPRRLVVGDFDRDGLDDLAVVCSGNFTLGQQGSLQLLRGTPSGALQAFPATGVGTGLDFPTTAAAADVDGDGTLEIAMGHDDPAGVSGVEKVEIFRYFAAGYFESAALVELTHPSPALAFADLDGDAFPELIVAGRDSLSVLRAPESGSEGDPAAYEVSYTLTLGEGADAYALAVADDGLDGSLDVVVASAAGEAFLLRGLKADEPPSNAPQKIDLADAGTLTDVTTADWNGDALPDFVFADKNNNRALLLLGPLGASAVEILETGPLPRRLALADLDASGLPDLLAASEAASGVLSLTLNETSAPDGLTLSPLEDFDAAAWFPGALGEISAFAAPNQSLLIAWDPRSGDLISFSAATGAELGRLSLVPFGIERPSGCWADSTTGAEEFFVAQFGEAKIYEFDAGVLDETLTLSIDAGFVGLAGVAEARLEDVKTRGDDIERPRYWALAPSVLKLFGVDRDTGAVLEQYNLPLPFTELAIDDDQEIAYFGVPTRSAVWSMPLTYGVSAPSTTRLELADWAPELAGASVRGLCWEGSDGQGLTVLTDKLAALGLGDPQDPPAALSLAPLPLRRGRRIVSLTANPHSGRFFALDADGAGGLVHKFQSASGELLSSFAVSPARSGDWPAFEAAQIAFDPLEEEIILSDAQALAFAIFGTKGDFRGHFSWADTDAAELGGAPILGLTVDPDSGDLLALTRRGVVRAGRDGSNATLQAIGADGMAGLALSPSGKLFSLAPEAARLDALPGFSGQAERSSGSLAPFAQDERPAGLAFRPSDGALIVSFGSQGRLEILQASAPLAPFSTGWILYE